MYTQHGGIDDECVKKQTEFDPFVNETQTEFSFTVCSVQVDIGSYVSHANQNLALFLSLCTHSMDEDEELAAMQSSSQPEPKSHKDRLRELRSRRTREQRFNKYAFIVHTLKLFERLLVLGTHVFILFFLFFLLLLLFFWFSVTIKKSVG